MKLYRFRAISPIENILDIVVNKRLHGAPYEKLNDPLEGVFLSVFQYHPVMSNLGLSGSGIGSIKSPPIISQATVTDLPFVNECRVCSLSATMADIRLWSHYAGGHTGVAIELDLDAVDDLHEVEYRDSLAEFTPSLLGGPTSKDVLRLKTKHWEYEREFRLLTKQEFYPIPGRITAIYLGLRTSDLMAGVILRSVADSIPVYKTGVNLNSLEIEQSGPLNRGVET